jgi:hypothetical protein
MSKERQSAALPEAPWYIETYKGTLDPRGADIEGLREQGVMPSDAETAGLIIGIVSEGFPNTTERASKLRKITRSVLESLVDISPDVAEAAHLVVAELLQNAYRYSEKGPTRVTIIHTMGYLMVSVMNSPAESPIEYGHESDDTHGRGEAMTDIITDGRHGRTTHQADNRQFENPVVVAYGVLDAPTDRNGMIEAA